MSIDRPQLRKVAGFVSSLIEDTCIHIVLIYIIRTPIKPAASNFYYITNKIFGWADWGLNFIQEGFFLNRRPLLFLAFVYPDAMFSVYKAC
jgi:hypothetical protein